MSLHTKYRPATFEEVLGQPAAVKSLKQVITDKRAKAFLFTGPSGTGKTTLARILANSFAQGKATAANIDEVDTASNSGAEAMRAVIKRTFTRAIGASPVKVFIIDECHRLSGTAWDVLLKPIEEPPSHVYWMLCSTNPSKVPKTIQTRCLRYDLKPVNEEVILKLLQKVSKAEAMDTDIEVLEAIAEQADGSPRQALVYLEACAYCESAGEARAAMRSAGQSKEVIDLCRFLIGGRGTWLEAMKLVKAIEGTTDAESARIVIANYFASALIGANSDSKAANLLRILECFKEPYNTSDRAAPLLLSIGFALGLDQ